MLCSNEERFSHYRVSPCVMNSFIKKIDTGYGILVKAASCLQPVLLLVVRLYWGWQFLQTGWGKIQNLAKPAEYFGTELGIPFPMLSATVVATTECVGGLLLLIGLASRLAAIPLTITMIVAYVTAEPEALRSIFSDPNNFLEATPFQFLFATVLVLAFGPGVFSLDYLIKRITERKRAG
jgi:putative oxidoreductase